MRGNTTTTAFLAVGVLLLVCPASARSLCQGVSLQGSNGCQVTAPNAPTSFEAQPRDGAVFLQWGRPGNGACVDNYLVGCRLGSNVQQQTVGANTFQATISGLQNGQNYECFASARARNFDQGFGPQNTATATATPGGTDTGEVVCAKDVPPTEVTNLRITQTGATNLQACWDPPARGCVDEYKVRIYQRPTAQLGAARSSQNLFNEFQTITGGCVDVQNLQSNTEYVVEVWPYTDRFGEARDQSTSVDATTT